jgi:uncharacterized protein (DUF1499 family)
MLVKIQITANRYTIHPISYVDLDKCAKEIEFITGDETVCITSSGKGYKNHDVISAEILSDTLQIIDFVQFELDEEKEDDLDE